MFDQILQLVKDHLGNNPQISNAIPDEQADAVHQEIASHIQNNLQNQAPAAGGIGGLLSQFEGNLGSGNMLTNAIAGGLVSSLSSKFGLPPIVTGAIAASLPALLQKLTQKNAAGNM